MNLLFGTYSRKNMEEGGPLAMCRGIDDGTKVSNEIQKIKLR